MARRNKGSPFEREVCRLLTDWWRGKPDADADVLYWRTSQSGGRATSRKRKGKQATTAHCGDITAIGQEGSELTRLITFELKRGYNSPRQYATLNDLLDRLPGTGIKGIESWIVQATAAADAAVTPYWAIVHRRDERKATMLIPACLYDEFVRLGLRTKRVIFATVPVRFPDGPPNHLELAMLPFQTFLDHVDPRWVQTLAKD